MEKEFKGVEETLKRLHELQENQLASFSEKAVPDLETQSSERNIEVGKLMKSLSDFMKLAENENGAATECMLTVLNNHVTILLEQNKALETKVKNFRDDIQKNMNQVSKGKKVIGSYRSSAAILNTPKVISLQK